MRPSIPVQHRHRAAAVVPIAIDDAPVRLSPGPRRPAFSPEVCPARPGQLAERRDPS